MFLLISLCLNISAVLSVTVVSDMWSIVPPHCPAPADDCGCRAAACSSAGDARHPQQSEGLLFVCDSQEVSFFFFFTAVEMQTAANSLRFDQ